MTLFFANPLWLFGALALIPLAAHLFSRTRPRRRPFPSLVLLREAARRVTRVRRPRDRWLLLLRTLAMAAIALAFLQPWLLSEFASKGAGAKTAVLVVDASASMGYVDGTRARIAQAAALAEEVLETLPANSRANVVWIRGRAESVAPEPSPNLEYLKQALRQAVAHPEPGDIEGALAQAAKQLAAAEGERELLIISDFQRSAWQGLNVAPPPGVQLTRVAVGSEAEENVAISELSIEPAEPMAGQSARMICRVRNLSGEPRRVTVYGEAGATRLSQALEVGAWSDALAIMPVTFSEAGTVLLKASAGEDRFPGDDTRHALLNVRGALSVAVVGAGDNATATGWLRAAGALDGVIARQVALEQLPGSGAKLAFVAGWNGANPELLRAFIDSGGVLVLQPAAGLPPQAANALWSPADATPEQAPWTAEERAAPGWGLRIAAEEHPVFTLFASGAYGDPVAGHFRRRVAAKDPGFRPLVTFEDGALALGIRDVIPSAAGAGRVAVPLVWWNLDLGATDWLSRSAFIPFFGEFVQYLASFTRSGVSREFRPGESLRFQPDPAVDPRDVSLLNEKDAGVEIATDLGPAGTQLISAAAVPPGAYRWTAQGGVLDRAVVNFPEAESDLRRIHSQDLEALGGDVISASALAGLAALREGAPLWPWLIAFAALCFIAEAILLRALRSPVAPAAAPSAPENKPAKPKEAVPA